MLLVQRENRGSRKGPSVLSRRGWRARSGSEKNVSKLGSDEGRRLFYGVELAPGDEKPGLLLVHWGQETTPSCEHLSPNGMVTAASMGLNVFKRGK